MKNSNKIRQKRMDHSIRCVIIVLAATLLFFTTLIGMTSVAADGGMIPFDEFSVYEPGQKAIIAWDGAEEIMILSVDVYSEESTKALHMVPFPSLPEVELGEVESFEKLNEIVNREMNNQTNSYDSGKHGLGPPAGSVEIMFSEKVGPHDITAVKVNSPLEFTKWVNNFLMGKGVTNKKLPDELDAVVGHYTDQDINYFAFDVIDIDPNEKSVDPIIYTFRSEHLFFPLEISSIIQGNSEITLALITPSNLPINTKSLNELGFDRTFDWIISYSDLKDISKEIADLLGDICSLEVYSGYFSLPDLEDDVFVKRLTNVNWMRTEERNIKNFQLTDLVSKGNYGINLVTHEKLSVVDASNGHIIHECKFKKLNFDEYVIDQSIIDINQNGIPDIIRLLGWEKNYVQALDGSDGTELWRYFIGRGYFYSMGGIQFEIRDDSAKVFVYTINSIYGLKGETGKELWSQKFEDENFGDIRDIFVKDLNYDNKAEVLVQSNSGTIILLDGEDGSELWRIKKQDIGRNCIQLGDINDNPGVEVVYLLNNIIYAIDSRTGSELWNTKDLLHNLDEISFFSLNNVDDESNEEIILFSPKAIYILFSASHTNLNEITINYELKYNNLVQYESMDIIDMDTDGKYELIGSNYDTMYIFDLEAGDQLWEFTTGEAITHYDVADIDDDGYSEVVLVAGNKVYNVEYHQDVLDSKNEIWHNEQIIMLGSIVIPLMIIVIVIILIFKTMANPKKR